MRSDEKIQRWRALRLALAFLVAFANLSHAPASQKPDLRIVPRQGCEYLFTPESELAINAARTSHPYVGEIFHNLLPLNRPTGRLGHLSPLDFVAAELSSLRGFARNLFLGPIYPQSVMNHIDIHTGKNYANTGNYWPLSFHGVDPALGTKEDYLQIVREADRLGIRIIQDIDIHHIGYLPQTPEQVHHFVEQLRLQGVEVPDSVDPLKEIYLWGRWRHLKDPQTFCQVGEIPQAAYDAFEDPRTGPEELRKAIELIQDGDLFGLKTLNLSNPEILNNVLEDHLWYIREAGVSQFRIDAAKHIRFDALKKMIYVFTQAVRQYISPEEKPAFFLEYWTKNYRNLRMMLNFMEPMTDSLYFFDYPLASTIRGALLHNASYRDFGRLLADRWQNRVALKQLIPIWIDHDFFVPIYTGTQQTLAQLAAGYAMAYMMSGNAPHFYNGFEKEAFGRPYDTTPAREPIYRLIHDESPAFLTIKSLKDMFSRDDVHEILGRSSDIFVREDSDHHLVIERRLDDRRKKVVARFSRHYDPGVETRGRLIWEYINKDASVRIYLSEW